MLRELASLVEGHLHLQLDVTRLSEEDRLAYERRVSSDDRPWASRETWEHRHYWSDSGEPEGLAYKIEIFEAIFRERGFEIRTPRLPGLKYRDLDEIE